MEGVGLYTACHDHKTDWIIIKAICDWADGNEAKNKDARQKKASKNAADFLIHAFRQVPLTRPLPPLATADVLPGHNSIDETGFADIALLRFPLLLTLSPQLR